MALNSKRMQTFFNEFLITTTSFLNQFASDCEDKFFELERKLNKIESNLVIIEQKLASVPSEEKSLPQNLPDVESLKLSDSTKDKEKPTETAIKETPPVIIEALPENVQPEPEAVNENLIKISESAVYRKYFKMLKVGIPPPAVKQKMMGEGLDADLLDNSELMIEKSPEDYGEQ